MTTGGAGPATRRMANIMLGTVTLGWFLSMLAYFARPATYPVGAEVHALMGAALTAAFGAAVWVPRRQAPPTAGRGDDDGEADEPAR